MNHYAKGKSPKRKLRSQSAIHQWLGEQHYHPDPEEPEEAPALESDHTKAQKRKAGPRGKTKPVSKRK